MLHVSLWIWKAWFPNTRRGEIYLPMHAAVFAREKNENQMVIVRSRHTTEHNNLIHLLCVSTSGVSCHFPIFDVCAWFISTFNSIYLEGESSSWIQSRGKLYNIYKTSAAVWEKGNQLKGRATDVIFTIWSQLTFCCSCTYNLLEILPEYSIYMAGGVVFTKVFAYITYSSTL